MKEMGYDMGQQIKKQELNLRQQRCLEQIKDYDMGIHYHPGKANVVADVLSQKAYCNIAMLLSHLLAGDEIITCWYVQPLESKN